jgi:LAO/AO transport system kinase
VRSRDPNELVAKAASGDRSALARLLSILEQGGEPARAVAGLTWPRGGHAYTVGITGAPGAGKSTLTDGLIGVVRATDAPVAVLAIDPSSPFTGGAVLGDRVRMSRHFLDAGVFIRSMASRGHLGGLSAATPEAVRALDAAAFPWVLLETVGVGQVEVEIAGEADTTVVVVNPGWGDAVQASKAGLLEIADVFVINKADRPGAAETQSDIEGMLELSRGTSDGWRPPVLRTTASDGTGVDAVWDAVVAHRRMLSRTGELTARRANRMRTQFRRTVLREIEQRVDRLVDAGRFDGIEDDVIAGRVDPDAAARSLVDAALAGPARDSGDGPSAGPGG